jgi:hypothetical protein
LDFRGPSVKNNYILHSTQNPTLHFHFTVKAMSKPSGLPATRILRAQFLVFLDQNQLKTGQVVVAVGSSLKLPTLYALDYELKRLPELLALRKFLYVIGSSES